MRWPKRIPVRWVVAAYFTLGQVYVWWEYAVVTPGHTRTPAEVVAPTVLEIIAALVIAGDGIVTVQGVVDSGAAIVRFGLFVGRISGRAGGTAAKSGALRPPEPAAPSAGGE